MNQKGVDRHGVVKAECGSVGGSVDKIADFVAFVSELIGFCFKILDDLVVRPFVWVLYDYVINLKGIEFGLFKEFREILTVSFVTIKFSELDFAVGEQIYIIFSVEYSKYSEFYFATLHIAKK